MLSRPDVEITPVAMIEAFSTEQLRPWLRTNYSYADLDRALTDLAEKHTNLFVFDIIDNNTSFRIKPRIKSLIDRGDKLEVVRRAHIYCGLINEALRLNPLSSPVVLAIELGDEGRQHTVAPTFTFQKRFGEANLLLPDFEIVSLGYLDAVPADTIPYDQKLPRAAFSGSTTGGGSITVEGLAANAIPRIRAARFFRNRPAVEFSLPNLVQCSSPDVESALRAEGFGVNRMDWPDSYLRKFLLSIDGNGAPCSRPALILRSNSALLKYASHNVLYYSSGLIPWEHYIPIYSDEEVLHVIARENAQPGLFAHVARQGLDFARKILSKDAILAYTNDLLAKYARLVEHE